MWREDQENVIEPLGLLTVGSFAPADADRGVALSRGRLKQPSDPATDAFSDDAGA